MRIALIRPNAFDNNIVITPHLGLGYISSYLKKCGHQTKLFDGLRDNQDNQTIFAEVLEYHPDFVGITATTSLYPAASELAVKFNKIFPVVLGGVHPSVLPEETLKDTLAKWVVIGDGEYSFRDIVNGGEAPGIVSGKPIKYLDDIPWPDWDEINLPKYPRAPWGAITKGWPVGHVITTRGCPYNCSFCAAPKYTQRTMRYRDPVDVVQEIIYLRDLWGCREININDDNFTVKRDHAVAVCEEMLKKNIGIPWACENGIRADRVDFDLLKLMKRAGCYRVAIGVESPNKEILEKAHKDESIGQIERAIRWAHEAGLETRGCFIIGLPGETKETMKNTAKWARKMPLDEGNFTMLDVLPGSELWYNLNGRFKANWGKKAFKDVEYIPEGLTGGDLIKGQQHAFRKFYTTPKRLWRILTRLRLSQFKHVIQRLKDYRIFGG